MNTVYTQAQLRGAGRWNQLVTDADFLLFQLAGPCSPRLSQEVRRDGPQN